MVRQVLRANENLMRNATLPVSDHTPSHKLSQKFTQIIALLVEAHSDRFPSHFIFVGDKMNTSPIQSVLGKSNELNSFK